MNIFYHPRFKKHYAKLPFILKVRAEEHERIFVVNPFDTRLETHKLHGKDREHWAYSINNKYRIKFLFLANRDVFYIDVGTHDQVY